MVSTSNSTELVRASTRMPSRPEINDLSVLANHLAHSNFFKDAKGGYQALAKLLFGRDLGLSATAAMTGVHIIEGKPEISANVQAQMVKTYIGPEGERYDYKIRKHTRTECEIEFFRRWERGGEWESLGSSDYSMEDARTAGLAGKDVWKKYPRNMLFARTMSDGVAFHCPEVTNGIRVYHENEIDVDGSARAQAEAAPSTGDVPLEGEIIDGEVVETPGNGAGPPAAVEQPSAPVIDKAMVDELQAARKAAGVDEGWLRMQLIAAGVEDVPDRITLPVIKRLTVSQANDLLDALNAAIEAKGGES